MDKISVKRLKSILAKYDDKDIAYVYGGESADGDYDYGYFIIAHKEEDIMWGGGDCILKYEY